MIGIQGLHGIEGLQVCLDNLLDVVHYNHQSNGTIVFRVRLDDLVRKGRLEER